MALFDTNMTDSICTDDTHMYACKYVYMCVHTTFMHRYTYDTYMCIYMYVSMCVYIYKLNFEYKDKCEKTNVKVVSQWARLLCIDDVSYQFPLSSNFADTSLSFW